MKKLLLIIFICLGSLPAYAVSSVCILNVKSTNVQEGYISCSGEEEYHTKPADELRRRLYDGYRIFAITAGAGNNTNSKWGNTYTLIRD